MDIKAPTFPESITEGTVAVWHKGPGEAVRRDDLLVDIETDKVVLEVVAPADGQVTRIVKQEGDVVASEELLASFEPGEVAVLDVTAHDAAPGALEPVSASPAARKLAEEKGLDIALMQGTGRDGRITKDDVAQYVEEERPTPPPPGRAPRAAAAEPVPAPPELDPEGVAERVERRVPMTRLRASIARRLVSAQQDAAMLTTFNEVDMSPVMALRRKYQDEFRARHNGTRLGFMSFFVRASVEALKRFPAVNASIDGDDIVYHGYYDIGVAVSTERGLVVPVVRDADALGMAQIEDQINEYGGKGARRQADHRGDDRRHLHALQRRHFRFAALDPHTQSAADRHSGNAQDPRAAGGAGRGDRGAAHDVLGALLRSPADRRQRRGAVFGGDQRAAGGSGAHPAGVVNHERTV